MAIKKVTAAIGKSLGNKYLPVALAVIAFIIFLPTLKLGLLLDDFIQWPILAEASEIPEQLHATGLVPENPGSLSTAVFQ